MADERQAILKRLQDLAAELRREGYAADAKGAWDAIERATYITLSVRITDGQTAGES